MRYAIRSKTNSTHPGFRRSGIYFASDTDTILDESQITEAILSEPMLIVTELPDKAEETEEAPQDEQPATEEEPVIETGKPVPQIDKPVIETGEPVVEIEDRAAFSCACGKCFEKEASLKGHQLRCEAAKAARG